MKQKTIEINYSEYDSIDDLISDDAILIAKARESSKNGWAPYSNFHVGAAVLLDNGEIILGNNQENAAYPSGLCAERVALYAANANYPHNRVVAIAISAFNRKGALEQPVSPCGSCRQAMLETEERFGAPIRIILDGSKSITMIEGIRNMLPLSFGKDSL
ncbi:MAG TPA: cytidine deaminase [Prolixibacteraceae bacterium]|nr:cytidine deaminase [Prolixibacteraceae bacterium]HPS13953.1 cytidine deaminase [Prolixibacteraceae bacterium]